MPYPLLLSGFGLLVRWYQTKYFTNQIDNRSCSPGYTHSQNMYKNVADLTDIRGLNRNFDSAHHVQQCSSTVVLFLTEIQIPSPWDTSHLQSPNYLLHSCFFIRANACSFFVTSTSWLHQTRFPSCGWKFSSHILFAHRSRPQQQYPS